MKKILLLLALVAATRAGATDRTEVSAVDRWREDHAVVLDATNVDVAAFKWVARPIVVFADSPADPRFIQQIELLAERPDDLRERDVVVIVDTDPAALTDLRRQLRPRGFMMVLISKDGTVNLRKPFPWSVRELNRSIDKMPTRQQEIRDRRVVD